MKEDNTIMTIEEAEDIIRYFDKIIEKWNEEEKNNEIEHDDK